MPGSHSALVASVAHAIGLFVGFDTPLEALVDTLLGIGVARVVWFVW
jgi:acid phosphatase family membrane protein YuiD